MSWPFLFLVAAEAVLVIFGFLSQNRSVTAYSVRLVQR